MQSFMVRPIVWEKERDDSRDRKTRAKSTRGRHVETASEKSSVGNALLTHTHISRFVKLLVGMGERRRMLFDWLRMAR